jgi:hypothetical protein
MKNRKFEHTGWFHLKVLNQIWSTDKLNIQEDSIQKFWIKHEVLTSCIYRIIQYKSFEPDMKNWQIKHTGWFNPILLNQTWNTENTGWFNPKVLNKTWSIDKLNIQGDSIQKFWTRHEVLTSWTYGVIQSKSFGPDMKYLQIEHKGRFHLKVLNQTWRTDKLNIQGDSIQVLNQTWSTDKLNIPEMFKTVGPVGPRGLILTRSGYLLITGGPDV